MFQTTNQHSFLSSSIHSGFCQKFCQVTVGFPPSGCNDSLVDVAEKSAGNHCQKRIYWSSHFSGLATFADVHLIGFQGDWLISMWGYCDKKTGEGQFCTNNFISKPTQLIQFQVAGSSPNPRCQIVKVILGGQARKTADPANVGGQPAMLCHSLPISPKKFGHRFHWPSCPPTLAFTIILQLRRCDIIIIYPNTYFGSQTPVLIGSSLIFCGLMINHNLSRCWLESFKHHHYTRMALVKHLHRSFQCGFSWGFDMGVPQQLDGSPRT